MSPRVIETKRCPHCKAVLPQPTPRVCPSCAGSLQKRFLTLGCLTSAPPIVLAMLGAAALLREAPRRAEHEVPLERASDADARGAERCDAERPRPLR